ncbi:heterokaryon incompatibility protein [Podospora didyma]|uniref:Heterokaryon incompatibility protein n=1 Tax=Podospora didyma TaxID=330526 RepID=A0AAE0NGB7_9PEZI|nr:heterokaryon incompatibility protein [Podospora didyma]
MSLCSLCQTLDLKDLVDWDNNLQDIPHHRSLEQLETAAASSCRLCKLFLDALMPSLKNADPDIWKDSPIILRGIQHLDDDYEPQGIFWLKVRCDRAGFGAYAYFSLYPDDHDPKSASIPENMIIGKKIEPPEQNIDLLSRWIADCQTNHSSCSASAKGPLPTRVINVGTSGSPSVRLETTTPDQTDHYMTLSHCWGPNPHLVLRTTKATLPSHLDSIPISKLTKTFRDAISVTRSVGVTYLWIDSLCIVQDDEDDWARESAKMGSIYANSYLTVAAAGSSDPTQGCFHPRPTPPADHHARVRCTAPDNGVGHVFIRPRVRDFKTLDQSPLHTRAWVTQERILSPRTVHYDTDQMLWECRESRVCESGVPESAFEAQRLKWDGRLHLRYPYTRANGSGQRDFWWDWYDLVQSYTTFGLTKGEDKLPALSGLAETLERNAGGGGRYVAGLWKDHMAVGLLWRKYGPFLQLAPGGYRAPTWSWASWDGHVCFHSEADFGSTDGHITCDFDVDSLQTEAVPSGLDPRGKLASGYMEIAGRIKAADARVDPSAPDYEKLPGVMESLGLVVDYLRSNGVVFGLAWYDGEYTPERCNRPVHCLRLVRRDGAPSVFHALLLEETDTKCEYRRIGMGEYRPYTAATETDVDFFADALVERIRIV